ncbi:MAG: hypothetical protein FD123_391 [Bacteroidetes bacterium]|nr:MAG: hypothetical protein FD123_391 [Bacteroidota bacterium]
MRLFDVCTRVVYNKGGEQKVKWFRIGIVKTTNAGKTYLRLFQQPETDFFVFDREAKHSDDNLPVIDLDKLGLDEYDTAS